jgi:hypothetical protein
LVRVKIVDLSWFESVLKLGPNGIQGSRGRGLDLVIHNVRDFAEGGIDLYGGFILPASLPDGLSDIGKDTGSTN